MTKNIHIVFDLDGTLADTQKIHERIESEFLASKGVHIEPQLIGLTYAGRSPIEWIPERLKSDRIDFTQYEIDAFIHSKDARVIALLEAGEIALMPGVRETLTELAYHGYKIGISSGACREFIDRFIGRFGLTMIEATTSADEVEHKKPAPDVFLSTFAKLEVEYGKPNEKWVIGDGKTDVIGGNASGAKTILCYHTHDVPYSYRIDHFSDISDIIIRGDIPRSGSRWRHYKSTGGDDHTYEVIGVYVHSETHEPMVIYRPLYRVPEDSWVYGYPGAVRPLSMWYDIVEYEGKKVQRFLEI